jgi:hypothetical protein
MAKNGDVHDERYVVVPWMAKNGDVHDERYVVVPWMAKNGDVHDERYVAVLVPFLGIHAFMALVFPYTSTQKRRVYLLHGKMQILSIALHTYNTHIHIPMFISDQIKTPPIVGGVLYSLLCYLIAFCYELTCFTT